MAAVSASYDPKEFRPILRRGADPVQRAAGDGRSQPGAGIPCRQLLMAHDPAAARCEEVRALRAELLLRRESTKGADVVALLSPRRGEGRSLLAAELAIGYAQTGQSTLMVDADLRHPRQHVLFGLDNQHGLASALRDNSMPQLDGVQGLPHLSLLTAGPAASNPLELLCAPAFATMIRAWRDSFRFVVIDTPPVADYSDGMVVASAAGRVLVMCRAQHTPYGDMQDMLRRLTGSPLQVVGAAINHF